MRDLLLRAAPSLAACAAALLASGAPVLGQADAEVGRRAVSAQTASIQAQSFGLQAHGDGLIGMGPDYKVYFRDGGFDFVPALGAAAPRSYPITFELESVHRGAEALHAADDGVRPTRDELRAEYARGPGIVERYDVLREGIEQSFVFDSVPGGAGDLVVRGKLSTDIELVRSDGAGGLLFDVPDFGAVHYGGVTGIDGAGRTAQGAVTLAGDRLELSLPDWFVSAAVPPLVLDPLIGTNIYVASTSSYDEGDPDVAYDATYNRYLVVWERAYSSTDYDIRGQLVTSAGDLYLSGFAIEPDVNPLGNDPSVANCTTSNRFFVAWEYRPTSASAPGIAGACVDASNGTVSEDLVLRSAATPGYDPDVGGEAEGSDDDVIVVYSIQDPAPGISARQVTAPTTGDPFLVGGEITVTTGQFDSTPAISKSGGPLGRLLVTWSRWFTTPAPGDADVLALVMDRNGNLLTGQTFVTDLVGPHEISPDCDGNGSEWVVVFERNPSSLTLDGDIYARRLLYQGGGLNYGTDPIQVWSDSSDEYSPSIGYTGGSYVVSYVWTGHVGTPWLKVGSIDPISCEICEDYQWLGITGYTSTISEVGTQYAGSSTEGTGAMVIWGAWDTTVDLDVIGFLYRSDHGVVTDLGGGCGSGGEAFASCAAYSNEDFTHRLDSTASSAPAYLILGLERIDLTCGSCTIVPDPFTGYVIYAGTTDTAGRASVAMPVPHDTDVVGFTFIDQWVVVDGSPSCSSLGVDLSNAIQVTIE